MQKVKTYLGYNIQFEYNGLIVISRVCKDRFYLFETALDIFTSKLHIMNKMSKISEIDTKEWGELCEYIKRYSEDMIANADPGEGLEADMEKYNNEDLIPLRELLTEEEKAEWDQRIKEIEEGYSL